jgi:hypothetical protein
VEDYHQCLKTGCHLEECQVQSAERLIRLLGLLSPLAVRLLQLRDLARRDPERPAYEVLDADLLAIVAAQAKQAPAPMTTGADLGKPWHTWAAIWPAKAMVLPVGKPYGKVGFVSKRCLRAFTWLFIFVCKMCIKDRAEARGRMSTCYLCCVERITRK